MVQPTSGAIRAANRANVVRVLRHVGAATRQELVRETRLSRATVSSVLTELRARGLVSELREAAPNGTGRPAARVSLNKSAGIAFAVDIGVRHVAVAVGDLSRSVLAERWTTLPQGHTSVRGTKLVLASIEDAVAQAGVEPDQLVGAAISIAAPVAAGSGELAVPGVLPGWNGSKLAECVAARWSIPVVTENDANLGALGEAVSRPATDGDVLYVKLASRIGLGIARGASILRGRDGYAGEFGHVTARMNGDPCWCGRRGCLELYAGGDGMLRRLAGVPGVSSLADLVDRAPDSREVRRVVQDGALMLARALADVAIVLNPARIVLGGELTSLGELIAEPIRRELERLPFGSRVEFAVSPLGERASLVGALALVLTEPARFADRSQLHPPLQSLSPEGSRR
ncbi:MAG TPA: ROK family transcriptional regulator [Jatrophihabitans sp.]|nr:ROK family transcriptional regulator [Jatrophihabitans sp.]